MTWPGPPHLGRGVVLPPSAGVPAPWRAVEEVVIDDDVLAKPARADDAVDRLHRLWVERRPVVIRWALASRRLEDEERIDDPPWRHPPSRVFPLERLRVMCFSNNYDAREGDFRWWWAEKARRIGATPGGNADVVLPDGTEAWIDGGPRHPLVRGDHPVIHGETIELGLDTPVPEPTGATPYDLAPDQLEAATHFAGPARIVAPAGSGKTRTLAARLRYLIDHHGVEPPYVTALAYNTRAADELRERIGADRRMVRTIHSLGWEILREARGPIELIEEADLRRLLDRILDTPKRYATDSIGPYIEALQRVRSGLVDPFVVEDERDDVPGFAAAFDTIRAEMYARGRVDHGEQVYGAIEALLRDQHLRARWQRACRHLLVDEFQDLTPAYVLLIRLVASPQLDVFGVGDDDQVIYGYDGADPGFLIDFDDYFPGAGSHALDTNYRCPPVVVDAALRLLSHNRRRITKHIRSGRSDRNDGDLAVEKVEGSILAVHAAERIAEWLTEGTSPADIAVLTRVNTALIPMKAALTTLGIPTADVLSAATLDRTTLRALFAWLRIGLDPERISVRDAREAIRRPHRKVNRLAVELITRRMSLDELRALADRIDGAAAERWHGFCDDAARLARIAARGTTAELIAELVHEIGLDAAASQLDAGRHDASRSSHHDDLVAVERAAQLHPDPAGFHAWLLEMAASPSRTDGVTLSTVHRVKGMEWPRVLIFGADRGAMPHALADDLEEERRVFHVALTRGIDRVAVFADASRPSRFLSDMTRLAPATAPAGPRVTSSQPPAAAPAPPPEVGTTIAVRGGYRGEVTGATDEEVTIRLEAGAELVVPIDDVLSEPRSGGETAGDDRLATALKQWRLETSKRLGVPAYVVLHDTTIEEITRRTPRTPRALLTVSGIGPKKLEDYGDDILEIIDQWSDAPPASTR